MYLTIVTNYEIMTLSSFPGVLAVEPVTGIATNTSFAYALGEGCEDDEGVAYQFAYVDSTTGLFSYYPIQAEPEMGAQLPPGMLSKLNRDGNTYFFIFGSRLKIERNL